jgi:hypothetical protein
MEKILAIIFSIALVFGFISSVSAATRVRGYYKPSTGSYVQPYYRSNSDSSRFNNYSTKGNYNPYTGKKGYIDPWRY